MLSEKYYVQFADMIAEEQNRLNYERSNNSMTDVSLGFSVCLNNFHSSLIALFKKDNPNFDESRFNTYIDNRVNNSH